MARVTLTYDDGASDIVAAYSHLLRELGMSRFTQYLGESIKRIGDRRFDAYMTTNLEEHKHMFEWGAKSVTPATKLWKTVYSNQTGLLTFVYVPSRKLVPATDEFTKYRHTFREKAAAMEEAPTVTIAPKNSRYLRWREGGSEIRSYQEIEMPVAGAVYRGKFNATFLAFWAGDAGGTMDDMVRRIKSSSRFRFDYNRAQIAGLKRRISNQQKKASTGSAQAKAMAAKRIKEIEMEVIKLGGTL